jgi:hypothetical protein
VSLRASWSCIIKQSEFKIKHFEFKQTLLNYLNFQYFNIEHTWWRLFEKCIVCTRFDIYVLSIAY